MKGFTECPAEMNKTLSTEKTLCGSSEYLGEGEAFMSVWRKKTYIQAGHPQKNKNHRNKGCNILIVLKLQIFE